MALVKNRKRRRRAKQIDEAEKIHRWLVFQRGLAGELIRGSVKLIDDKEEAANARLDLYMIVRDLAAAAPGSWNAIWKDYQRHFIGDENRQLFFRKLQRITRRVASISLVGVWRMGRERNANIEADFQWDSSLLPKSIAPWVVRLAILHPGVLEHFLPRFFVHASDCLLQGSTYRRALLILSVVPEFGWWAEKHTKRLIDLGELQWPGNGSSLEKIKKFIRDLRHRHKKLIRNSRRRRRKHVPLKRRSNSVKGTS